MESLTLSAASVGLGIGDWRGGGGLLSTRGSFIFGGPESAF